MKIKELPDYDTGLSRCKKNICPACGSDQVEVQEVEIMAGSAAQDVSCAECPAEWREYYTMTEFSFYGQAEGA